MDLSDIKATIRDTALLQSIIPSDLQKYLEKNGFEEKMDYVYDDEVIGKVFTGEYKDTGTPTVIVINDPTHQTYGITMASNLSALEQSLELSQIQIFLNITGHNLHMFNEDTYAKIGEEIERVMNDLN